MCFTKQNKLAYESMKVQKKIAKLISCVNACVKIPATIGQNLWRVTEVLGSMLEIIIFIQARPLKGYH